jgi:hypothetical protein
LNSFHLAIRAGQLVSVTRPATFPGC